MTFFAKKSLGQNFLKSKQAVRSIIAAGLLSASDTILEIGPGKGVLTEEILKHAGKVIAIEKDSRLIETLREKFSQEISAGKFQIIEGDILELSATKIGLADHSYKLIANIPYYITGQIIRLFLESEAQPERMVLMLQKEVADRIVARDGKESILSISVKAYGEPKYIEKVPAKYFSPEPNVDSAILLIKNISKNNFSNTFSETEIGNAEEISEKDFFKIVKAGFAHKRKKLAGNLSEFFPKEKIAAAFAEHSIEENSRAEDLSCATWLALAKELHRKNSGE